MFYYIENISDTDIIFLADHRGTGTRSRLLRKNHAYKLLGLPSYTGKEHRTNLKSELVSLSFYDNKGLVFMTLQDIREYSFVTEWFSHDDQKHYLQIRQGDIEKGYVKYAAWPELIIAGAVIETAEDSDEIVYYRQFEVPGDTGPPEDGAGDWVIENGTLTSYRGIERDVVIPQGITAIGEGAFRGRPVISVVIPDTVVSIGGNAFETCRSLEAVAIPESVMEIGTAAFARCISLRSIQLPESLQQISSRLFSFCARLEQVALPEGLAGIGDYAFASCLALDDLSLPPGLVHIGAAAFRDCRGITRLVIPDSLVGMGDSIFGGCIALEDLALSPGLSRLGRRMFENCTSLRSVVLPPSVEVIGEAAFYRCENLVSVTMSGVRVIEKRAFWNLPALQNITFPESLVSIGEEAFSYSRLPANIRLPRNLSVLEDGAFRMSETQAITVDEDNPYFASLEGVLFDKTFETLLQYPVLRPDHEYHIPESVTVIGPWALSANQHLRQVYLPAGITEIGDRAFRDCRNLESVNLPEGLRRIGSFAFGSCESLARPTLPQSLEETGEGAFSRRTPWPY